MNILILGSGGREHALAYTIAASDLCDQVYILPGNAGTDQVGINIEGEVTDVERVKEIVKEYHIHGVIIGPEQPLVNGMVDQLGSESVWVFGPSKAAALLEGSKAFSKAFMARYQIPTAAYASFDTSEKNSAFAYLDSCNLPIVIKASGLAAGKGVLICETREEARQVVDKMLSGTSFGHSGRTVVIEEFLDGIEVSMFAIVDGLNYVLLPWAKDYKRIGEGDTGLNTGGMGAVTPVPFVDEPFIQNAVATILEPTLAGLKQEGIHYRGFLFIGLMVKEQTPFVLEYNVRLGDPETEVILPLLTTDLLSIIIAAVEGKLSGKSLNVSSDSCCTIMLVSGGYPEKYEKGKPIEGLDRVKDALVFHAGTKKYDNRVVTNGGRVLAISTKGKDIEAAVEQALSQIEQIYFEGMNYRKDIGRDIMVNDG